MTEERKQQANILLNEITNNIISQQRIALSKSDKNEYDKLCKAQGLINDIQNLLINAHIMED